MTRKPVYGDHWAESCLERSLRLGEQVYLRALARQNHFYPPVKQDFYPQDTEDVCEEVSVDEAYHSVMGHLHQASNECKKYHSNKRFEKNCQDSAGHCALYHTPLQRARNASAGKSLASHDTVYLTLPEGAYGITVDKPGAEIARTTTIRVTEKNSHHALYFKL